MDDFVLGRLLPFWSKMDSNQLQRILDRTAYMWFRDGLSIEKRTAVGFRAVPGSKSGQEIQINNFGTVERPDFRYLLYQNGERTCEHLHFRNPQDALKHSMDWSAKTDPRPELRRFEWYNGHYGWILDGGVLDVEVMVIEVEKGRFSRSERERGHCVRYSEDPRWTCPMDALAL